MATAQKLRCQVTRLVDHGEHVYTVDLRPERPAPRFRPGQFLHLALDEYDPSGFWPESRVFSIASAPTQRDLLRISYSVRGRFTARMERELAEGGWVWVKLPYGEFIIEDTSDIVLFAGGTGITAFTAFLDGLTPAFRHAVVVAYGARSADLLIYRGLIEARAALIPGCAPAISWNAASRRRTPRSAGCRWPRSGRTSPRRIRRPITCPARRSC